MYKQSVRLNFEKDIISLTDDFTYSPIYIYIDLETNVLMSYLCMTIYIMINFLNRNTFQESKLFLYLGR